MVKRAIVALALLGIPSLAPTPAPGRAPDRPVPPISRVLVISVDGLRPDLALVADAPVIRGLMKRGSYSLWAETTDLAVTLPSHVSMLTGVPPSQHGVDWNSRLPEKRGVYSAWPTLFELATRAGYTTAMAAGKSKFSTLAKPGTLTWSFVPESSIVPDTTVTSWAVDCIEREAPQVLFVHLPEVDSAGHESGWGSPGQLAAIAVADGCIGRLLAALSRRGLDDSTFVLVTADHGGAGRNHGPGDPRSRMIPWIAAGPGVRAGFDLTSGTAPTVRTEDTFATAAYLLGIQPPRPIVGRPVVSLFAAAPENQTRH